MRRIQESSERSPRKSTERAENLEYRNHLACVEAPFTVQATQTYELSPSFLITLFIYVCSKNYTEQINSLCGQNAFL